MISPELLLRAYCSGYFPMAMDGGEIGWFSPDPRTVIPLDAFHVPHGLRRAVKKGAFQICFDRDFEAVIRHCSARRATWISEEIIQSYCRLHELGLAHSVEAWQNDQLAGGLYGVSIAGAFFGESMFHRVTDASKVALYHLVQHLRARGFLLLDSQWLTPHLATFGATEIRRATYLRRLAKAIAAPASFRDE